MLAAQHCRLTIYGETGAVCTEFAHAEADKTIVLLINLIKKEIQRRLILAPFIVHCFQRNGYGSPAVLICFQLCLEHRHGNHLISKLHITCKGKSCCLCAMKLHRQCNLLLIRIRISLHMIGVYIRKYTQHHFSGNPVPVRLGIRRGQMAALGRIAGILHQNHNFRQRLCHKCRNIIDMGRAKAVTGADLFPINPKGSHPRPLQRQLHWKPDMLRIYIDGFTKPGLSFKGIGIGQKSRFPVKVGTSLLCQGSSSRQGNGICKCLRHRVFPHLRHGKIPDTRQIIASNHTFLILSVCCKRVFSHSV